MPRFDMKLCKDLAVKHVALSDIMFLGCPNAEMISSWTKYMTTSAVLNLVQMAIGQFVTCSTAIKANLFPVFVSLNGPAKSIEKVSNNDEIGNLSVVL